ncbi:MAG: MBL fold metallo-hydrolase [Proteobacteria bacterium]|nr:MBL fold metallo-hydrolase [Pseudomonadota bacterium]
MRHTIPEAFAAALVVACAGAFPTASQGQATPASVDIPQPHLAEARRIAAEENTWKHTALITCYPEEGQAAQKVIKDPPASRAFDNLYFLGNGIVASWALDTPEGIVLIDAMNDQAEVDRFIIGGLRKLGVDPARIKIVLVSHGHGDHYGGAKYLQELYGAKVYMPRTDYDMAAQSNGGDKRPLPRLDTDLRDGDSIKLGGQTLRAFVTGGHTPGSISLLLPVLDKGRAVTIAFFGGITNRNIAPAMHVLYDQWTGRFQRIVSDNKVEGFIGNHPSFDDVAGKLVHMVERPTRPNPFLVGTEGTLRFLRVLQQCNLNNADIEKGGSQPPTAGP